KQADGSVVVRSGDSVVLVTAVSAKEPKPGLDFFPLTVDYQERLSAAGRIPGSFFRREGRLTERETLISRLIDRSLRPPFPAGYLSEAREARVRQGAARRGRRGARPRGGAGEGARGLCPARQARALRSALADQEGRGGRADRSWRAVRRQGQGRQDRARGPQVRIHAPDDHARWAAH